MLKFVNVITKTVEVLEDLQIRKEPTQSIHSPPSLDFLCAGEMTREPKHVQAITWEIFTRFKCHRN